MIALTRRGITASVAGLTLAASLAGCGLGASVVGLHDAPAERTDAAPLNVDGAEKVAARVLDAAAAARGATGTAAAKAQSEVLAGAALAQAKAATRLGTVTASDPLQQSSDPEVVAVSSGKAWPRAILVGTLDKASKTQTLHVLMSASATEPFKVHASVPMLPGTSIPAIGDLAVGSPLVKPTDKAGALFTPIQALTGYASGLNYPKPTVNKSIPTTDAYATALRSSTAAQVRSLGKLATLSQKHTVVPDNTIAFRLADGGTVTFGQLVRKDVITANKAAKELVIPGTYSKLIGKTKANKSITINSLENLVMVVPATGTTSTVGADEQIVSATAE
ncbi:hypothetical protein [Knoellia sp. Soil729]|uniref:hypothetical protein n=1 Tax=Knoellia sp. Soil729 TaxID=1736394 RepID=UPI0007003B24|nr:hypothetical protein [Knoellia sp. Soil729]KRE41999.1 hypothetical protein ASG74_05840 [Knoellia sp. Soil729]